MAKAKSEMPAEVAAPVVEAPAYDPANLADVLKRLRALALEVQTVSGDLAGHYQKHSRVHHTNGRRRLARARGSGRA